MHDLASSSAAGLHHRGHELLQDYWNALRGSRLFPAESEIDPDALSDIWASCYLISIDDVTRRVGYRYSYLGEQLMEACGDDIRNPDICMRLLSTATPSMAGQFDEVVRQKHPVVSEADFTNLKHVPIRYRTCMLPLGFDRDVSHIIGCMRWRAY